jgi:hypothetical protein
MKSPFLFLIVFFASFASIYAQNPAGTWNAAGKNPDGSAYRATVKINKAEENRYTLLWNTGNTTYSGVGYMQNNSLFAAWGQNITYGLAIYKVNQNGTLDGTWYNHTLNAPAIGAGSEKLSGGKGGQVGGVYQCNGSQGGNQYAGKVSIKHQTGIIYKLTWDLGDGAPYNGIGFLKDGYLIVAWGIGEAYGLVSYDFTNAGATGTWIAVGIQGSGTENLSK